MPQTLIRGRNIKKEFGEEGILREIDIEIKKGEIVLLMGPNGVGKTVLLSCLTGGLPPSEGEIELFEKPLTSVDKNKVSFLLQDALSMSYLSGRENLNFYSRLSPNFNDYWKEVTQRLGLEEDLDKTVKDYSGGMKKKLELAISLSTEASLFFLDEPTAALDLSAIQKVQDMIMKFNEKGKTFLISSHLPGDAKIADRILYMKDGDIIANSSPEDMLDGVPDVLVARIPDREMMEPFKECVMEGEIFEKGGEIRGFLIDDIKEEDHEKIFGDERYNTSMEKPNYTDMFNYYKKIPS